MPKINVMHSKLQNNINARINAMHENVAYQNLNSAQQKAIDREVKFLTTERIVQNGVNKGKSTIDLNSQEKIVIDLAGVPFYISGDRIRTFITKDGKGRNANGYLGGGRTIISRKMFSQYTEIFSMKGIRD